MFGKNTRDMAIDSNLPQTENPLRHLWRAIVQPPYTTVPWLIFFYVLISGFVYVDNGPLTGHIVGFDDQVRMTQVLQWVNGAGWYDRLITRVNAPEGFQSIWARIVDIPIATVVILAQQFMDQRSAALMASIIVPMAELILMFWATCYLARPYRREKRSPPCPAVPDVHDSPES